MSDPSIPLKAVGYRLVIRPVEPIRRTAGGIILADESVRAQEHLGNCGIVEDMGELAYTGKKFEGSGPWCQIGDYVAFNKYAGQLLVGKPLEPGGDPQRWRVMNDDEVLCRITDPEALEIPL